MVFSCGQSCCNFVNPITAIPPTISPPTTPPLIVHPPTSRTGAGGSLVQLGWGSNKPSAKKAMGKNKGAMGMGKLTMGQSMGDSLMNVASKGKVKYPKQNSRKSGRMAGESLYRQTQDSGLNGSTAHLRNASSLTIGFSTIGEVITGQKNSRSGLSMLLVGVGLLCIMLIVHRSRRQKITEAHLKESDDGPQSPWFAERGWALSKKNVKRYVPEYEVPESEATPLFSFSGQKPVSYAALSSTMGEKIWSPIKD